MTYQSRCTFLVMYTNTRGEFIKEHIQGNFILATAKRFQTKYANYISQWHGISFVKYNYQ